MLTRSSEEEKWKRKSREEIAEQRFQTWSSEPKAGTLATVPTYAHLVEIYTGLKQKSICLGVVFCVFAVCPERIGVQPGMPTAVRNRPLNDNFWKYLFVAQPVVSP